MSYIRIAFINYYAFSFGVATALVMISFVMNMQSQNVLSIVSFSRQDIEDRQDDWTLPHGSTVPGYEDNVAECRRN